MLNQQALAHHWEEVRDRLREKYDRLAEDDLPKFPGNIEQLIGRIHNKTGAPREAVEAFLAEVTDQGEGLVDNARKKVQQTASKVAETARHQAESMREGYAEAGEMIRRRPGQAVVAAFGLGVVCGLGVALLLKSSSRPVTLRERGRHALDDAYGRGRHALDDAYGRGRHALDAAYEHGRDSLSQGRRMASRLGQQLRDSWAHYRNA